ncbi:MAG: alpha/beta hydrolase [Fusobacteriales bacterium]|nr:alpha/beta hydrolase [Fusobacteriales bacterium]
MICSKDDTLSDEAEHYAECLEKTSVRVEFVRYPGLNHTFMHTLIYLEEYCEIYNNISDFLNKEKKT